MNNEQRAIANNYISNTKNEKEYIKLIFSQRELIKTLLLDKKKNCPKTENKYIKDLLYYLDIASEHIEMLGELAKKQQDLLNESVNAKRRNNSR